MNKKFYFTQLSAPIVAGACGCIAVQLLKFFLGDWYNDEDIVNVVILGTIIITSCIVGMILWGKFLVLIGILNTEEAKGYPFSKPWEDA